MVSPYFFLENKTDDLLSHLPLQSDDLFSRRLLFPRRLSSVLPKYTHKKFLFGCYLLDGVTLIGPPFCLSDATV